MNPSEQNEFKCPDCNLSCIVNLSTNTVNHQLPHCTTFQAAMNDSEKEFEFIGNGINKDKG